MKRAILLLLALPACTSDRPHRVTDLKTGRVYYTKHMKRGLASGKVYLVDATTGEEVTVGSSAISELTEEEFAREVRAK